MEGDKGTWNCIFEAPRSSREWVMTIFFRGRLLFWSQQWDILQIFVESQFLEQLGRVVAQLQAMVSSQCQKSVSTDAGTQNLSPLLLSSCPGYMLPVLWPLLHQLQGCVNIREYRSMM